MAKLTKKQEAAIERRIEERVEEAMRRKRGKEEYQRICDERRARGQCTRCGSRRCVCDPSC